MAEADYVFKVLVIGDSCVGKSSLIRRFHEDKFEKNYLCHTIGVDFSIHDLELDGKKVKLHLWDTAGHEKYKAMTSTYYRGAHGALIVFDITCKESFQNVKDYWLKKIYKESGAECLVIAVGSKYDLKDKRKVTEDEIQDFCDLYSLSWVETSAKNSINIKEAFESLSRKLMTYYDEGLSIPSHQSGPGSFTLHGAYNVPDNNSESYMSYCSCGTLH